MKDLLFFFNKNSKLFLDKWYKEYKDPKLKKHYEILFVMFTILEVLQWMLLVILLSAALILIPKPALIVLGLILWNPVKEKTIELHKVYKTAHNQNKEQ